MSSPLTIRMHAEDNVAIVANDGGLPAGTLLPAGVPGATTTRPGALQSMACEVWEC